MQWGLEVADKGDDIGVYLAAIDPGAGTSFTDCHSEDGLVEIELDPNKKTTAEGKSVVEANTETIGQETGTETGDASIAQGKTAGRVSGIATLIVDGAGQAYESLGLKSPIYSYGPNKLTGGAETHITYEGMHPNDDDYKMTIQEQSYPSMDMKVTQFGWGPGTNATASLHYFKWNQGGSYTDENGHEYLEWGWWEDTSGTDPGQIATGSDYRVATNKIWEIEGLRTHTDYISYLRQQGASYTYSGEAKGVIAHSDSGAGDFFVPQELSGSFSCHINFGNKQVSDFDINATGGAHSVHITGSGNLESDGGFKLGGFTGTIDGNSVADPGAAGAGGSLFGGKAEGMAGDWAANDGADYWATGEFHGKR